MTSIPVQAKFNLGSWGCIHSEENAVLPEDIIAYRVDIQQRINSVAQMAQFSKLF